MKSQLIVAVILTAIIVGIGGFYGGIMYQKSQSSIGFGQGGRFGGGRYSLPGRAGGPNTSVVRGSILSNDGKTLTVKLGNGSSKIIILSDQTNVTEATTAAQTSLQAGKDVTVFGTLNPDGSITAQNVTIGFGFRPRIIMGQ